MELSDLFAAVVSEATAAGQPSARAVEAVRLYESGKTAVEVCRILHCSTTTLRKLIDEGGGKMRGKHRPATVQETTGHATRAEAAAAVAARFRETGKLSGLAREFGLARTTVWALLLEAGVARENLTAARGEWIPRAIHLYSVEMASMEDIRVQLGVTRHQVRWALIDNGIPIRKVGRPPDRPYGSVGERREFHELLAQRYASSEIGMRKLGEEFGVPLSEVEMALRVTGTPKRTRGGSRRTDPLTDAEKTQIRELYAQTSVERVAAATGVPWTMVKAFLVGEGLLGLPGPKNRRVWTPELERELLEAYGDGLTMRQVQHRFHVSEYKLRRLLREAGVLRRQGPPLGYRYPPRS